MAGEKKGHFRIRDCFDLYLTQGPYFTKKFEELKEKYKNFEVIETGWSKLDNIFTVSKETEVKREELRLSHEVQKIVLYAPTFSPSLTSASELKNTIEKLSIRGEILFLIKFHDKMDKETVDMYKAIESPNIIIVEDKDITQSMQMADLMVSDTSSVVYEFIFMDKPVITLNSQSENITWSNHNDVRQVSLNLVRALESGDRFIDGRQKTIAQYHPYNDGKSSLRMIEAVDSYIAEHGVPEKRKVPLLRRWKLWRKYR